MGNSAARGLAFGKPLVVTGEYGWFDTFGAENAAEHYRNSFWSEMKIPDATGELLSHLRPLLNDAEHRARLGVFGRRFAEEHFSLRGKAKALARVYDESRAYGSNAWLGDLLLESRWAAAWMGKRVFPKSPLSVRARRWTDEAARRIETPEQENGGLGPGTPPVELHVRRRYT
jgi:hypothetical protein